MFLRHGVTTVRNAADADGTSAGRSRTGPARGEFPGPRSFACGPVADGPRTMWANTRVIETRDDAAALLKEIVAGGFDCVKVYDDLTPEALAAIREEASRRGIPVIGHVPRRMAFEEAGLDDSQHIIGVAAGPGAPPTEFPANMSRWASVGDERLETVAAALLEHGGAITPTLVSTLSWTRLDEDPFTVHPELRLLPRFYQDVVWARSADMTDEVLAAGRTALDRQLPWIASLHARGVPIHVGSDALVFSAVPGISIHREMALLEQAGIAAEEVWALATRGNGEGLGEAGLGIVEEGAPADLLVFREDPTRNLAAWESLEAVVADGRLYRVDDLEAQIQLSRRYFEGWLFDRVTVEIARRTLAALQTTADER